MLSHSVHLPLSLSPFLSLPFSLSLSLSPFLSLPFSLSLSLPPFLSLPFSLSLSLSPFLSPLFYSFSSIAASAPIWQFPGLCDCGVCNAESYSFFSLSTLYLSILFPLLSPQPSSILFPSPSLPPSFPTSLSPSLPPSLSSLSLTHSLSFSPTSFSLESK